MARKRFGKLSKEQAEVTPQTQWTAMLAGLPGVLPKSPGGEGDDVVAYDNVVALTEGVDAATGALVELEMGVALHHGANGLDLLGVSAPERM